MDSPGDRSTVFLEQVQYRQQPHKCLIPCQAFTFVCRMSLEGGTGWHLAFLLQLLTKEPVVLGLLQCELAPVP